MMKTVMMTMMIWSATIVKTSHSGDESKHPHRGIAFARSSYYWGIFWPEDETSKNVSKVLGFKSKMCFKIFYNPSWGIILRILTSLKLYVMS